MKEKTMKGNWSSRTKKFELPSVFFICIVFFIAGFLVSGLFYRSQDDEYVVRQRPRLLELTKEEMKYKLLHSGESGDDSITSIPFQVLSWRPRALYFPNFASAEQCKSIINMAEERLKPSTVAFRQGDTEESTKGIRTRYERSYHLTCLMMRPSRPCKDCDRGYCFGMFIAASEDKTGILDVIEEKIAKATMIPRTHGEAFNVLRYEVGQKYSAHYDVFDPAEYGPQKSNRMGTFLLYLTDVEEGGETTFPFENGLNMEGNYDYEKCIGLRVKPRQGDGLLFYSLFPNGTIDPTSLHGSCPVIKGKKWVTTKWIRDQTFI